MAKPQPLAFLPPGLPARAGLRLMLFAALMSALASGAANAQSQAASDVRPAAPINSPGQKGSTPAGHPRAHNKAPAALPVAPTSPTSSSTAAAAAPATPADADARESAKAAFRAPTSAQLRPTGPITVTSDRAELVQGNYAIYSGHVVLDSDTLKMRGNRLELRQTGDGQFTAKITGTPAHLDHPGNHSDDPPVTAHAQTLTYDSQTELVTLSGKAQLTRGKNIVNGETINYDALNHRVQANGGKSGQIKMVIQPPPPPAPTPPETPAP